MPDGIKTNTLNSRLVTIWINLFLPTYLLTYFLANGLLRQSQQKRHSNHDRERNKMRK